MNRRGFLGFLTAGAIAVPVARAIVESDKAHISERAISGWSHNEAAWNSTRYAKPELALVYGGKLHENLVQSTARDIYMEVYAKAFARGEDMVLFDSFQ